MKSTQNSNEYGDRKITKNSRDFQTCGCFFRALIWMGLFPSQSRTILIHMISYYVPISFSVPNVWLIGQSTLKAERCLFAKDGLPGPLLTVERPTDGHAEGTTGATAVKRRSVTAPATRVEWEILKIRPFTSILQNRLVLFHGLLLFTLYQVSCSFLLTLNELPREILKLWYRVTRASKLHQELATNCTLAEKHGGCNFPVIFAD